MSDKYYSRVLMHGSKYGGFITKNGRKNNSSEYNHNYYLANIFKWKKKDEDNVNTNYERLRGERDRASERYNAIAVNNNGLSKIINDLRKKDGNRGMNSGEKLVTLKQKKYLYRAKNKLRDADYNYRKAEAEYKKTQKGKKEQAAKDKKTKAAREKHLSKDYVDMTSNKKRTMQQIVRGDKFLEKHSDSLFSSSVKYTDSNGRVTELKNVGKAERAARKAKKKVDKFLNSLGRKKKKKNNIKVSHQTYITSQPRLVSKRKR